MLSKLVIPQIIQLNAEKMIEKKKGICIKKF